MKAKIAAEIPKFVLRAALPPSIAILQTAPELTVARLCSMPERLSPPTYERLLCTLSGHTHVVGFAAFSPDGRYLATASDDNTAKVWDGKTGKELLTLRGHAGYVPSVAFSPDGKQLATASGYHGRWEIKVWDTTRWKEKRDGQ